MTLTYRLDRDIVARTAAQLNWNLKQIPSSIRIIHGDRIVNGKSLIGIMSANMRFDDTISVIIDDIEDMDKVKEFFDEVGGEI